MKKLFFVLFLFASIASMGQTTKQVAGHWEFQWVKVDSALYMPVYTTTGRPSPIIGLEIFNSDSGKVQIGNGSSWTTLGASVGGSPVLSVFGRTGYVSAQSGDYSSYYYPLTGNPSGFLSSAITSAGSLSPLFSTSSSTSSTINFTLNNAAAYSIFGNPNGSSGAPVYFEPNAGMINTWYGGTLQLLLSGTGYAKFAGSTASYVASIPNSDLANSQITINGTAVSLGGSITVSSGGGGSADIDSIQYVTSGSSVTVSNGYNKLYVKPSSTLSSLAITLPAVAHNSNHTLIIAFGDKTNIPIGSVVTALSFVANTGQGIVIDTYSGGANAADMWQCIYDYTNTTWYLKKM